VDLTMSKDFRVANKCRICRSTKLYKFLDLGSMPVANGFRKKEELNKKEKRYELACNFCEKCGLVQLSIVVDPDIMFKNYLYVPSTSKVMMNNFSSLAYQAFIEQGLDESSTVVDIGSNDGSLLIFFKTYDSRVVGIDPAENIAKVAELNGIPTEIALFNTSSAKRIKKKYGQADVITGTNVMAHIDDLGEVFKGIEILLKKDGIFITEFPYLVDLIEKLEFDTVYHEHLSYFSLRPWKYLVEKFGFEICGLRKLRIHGGSIRLTHRRRTSRRNPAKKALEYFLNIEEQKGLNNKKTYDLFSQKVNNLKKELTGLMDSLVKDGHRVVGYGAAAKGNVLTNFFNIGIDRLDYIVDSVPYKQGLFTPGMGIPIYAENKLQREMPDYALILAWNFANEIMEKQEAYRAKGGRFIIPIPEVKII
jgi:2-polyprenyl-3-methyl-5-hydroxy-6-metoxy-1,4-benzoquinol methylase